MNTVFSLFKISVHNGVCSDEMKVEMLIAFKATVFAFVFLYYCLPFLDFEFAKGFAESVGRLNQLFWIFRFQVQISEVYLYVFVAVICGVLTFACVRTVIKFAYYYHFITKTTMEQMLSNDKLTQKFYKRFSMQMHVCFIFPLLISTLYIPTITKNAFVPLIFSSTIFSYLRISLILCYLVLKCVTLRKEVQFNMNQSYSLVRIMVNNPSEQIFSFITTKMRQNFETIWKLIYQYASAIIIPFCLIMLLFHRGVLYGPTFSNKDLDFSFLFVNNTETNSNLEAMNPDFNQSFKNETFYEFPTKNETIDLQIDNLGSQMNLEPEVSSFEDVSNPALKGIVAERKKEKIVFVQNPFGPQNLLSILGEVNAKGIFKPELYRNVFNFMIFWYFFSSFIVSIFALLYYRKYKETKV